MHEFRERLQGQHYKMAAIVAEGWAYEEETEEGKDGKRGRKKSVCQFDTSKLFEYTNTEKNINKLKYFDFMSDERNRIQKIDKCVSGPPGGGNANILIDKLFISHLITQETESTLGVLNIEENFLKLIKISSKLTNDSPHIINNKKNVNIIKDYIALQYVRNPLFYRFLINAYFHSRTKKMCENIDNNIYNINDPILFKELTLLNNENLLKLIDFCNNEIISIYYDERKKIEDYHIMSYSHESVNNYLGDMTSFNFDFQRLGLNPNEVQKITDYKNNKLILDDCIYTATSSTSFILAIEPSHYSDKEDIELKFRQVILPVILKGFHNQIIFIYSKYIICNPLRKNHMLNCIKQFFQNNSLKYFYDVRDREITYLETLEKLLVDLKIKEDNFR